MSSATRLVVWLLPEPVRTAQTATHGFVEVSIVSRGDNSVNDAPAASARDATCITSPCLTSEYEKTTWSTSRSAISASSSSSGTIGIPSG